MSQLHSSDEDDDEDLIDHKLTGGTYKLRDSRYFCYQNLITLSFGTPLSFFIIWLYL